MSGINVAESGRGASADRIPEKRVFKLRSIPDIRVQEVRVERGPETPVPADALAGELQADASLRQSGHVPEPPAFRRDGARPPRTPAPV